MSEINACGMYGCTRERLHGGVHERVYPFTTYDDEPTPEAMSDTSNAPSTASGKELLDDYYQPDTGWVDAWDGGGLEARIRAIEDEAMREAVHQLTDTVWASKEAREQAAAQLQEADTQLAVLRDHMRLMHDESEWRCVKPDECPTLALLNSTAEYNKQALPGSENHRGLDGPPETWPAVYADKEFMRLWNAAGERIQREHADLYVDLMAAVQMADMHIEQDFEDNTVIVRRAHWNRIVAVSRGHVSNRARQVLDGFRKNFDIEKWTLEMARRRAAERETRALASQSKSDTE